MLPYESTVNAVTVRTSPGASDEITADVPVPSYTLQPVMALGSSGLASWRRITV